jgi:uncharacterized protein (TIGR02453 family)
MTPFTGFTTETISFFKELRKNNQRAWFDVNRERYQQQVILPAQAFVLAMGDRLRSLSPNVIADPRSNGSGSIYRLHRDTRFSKDKTPYKTNLGIFFWHGSPRKGNQPGFYFHLEAEQIALYGGMYVFEKETMERYRHAVTQPESGRQLLKAVKKVESDLLYQVGGLHYKRIPKGFSEDQDPRDFLRYNTFYTVFTAPLPPELYSNELIDYCHGHYKKMFPVMKWLLENLM